MLSSFTLGILGVLLCIGSVLTDCICTAGQTDIIARLLKSDFRGIPAGN